MNCGFRPGDRIRIKSKEKQSKGHGFESPGMDPFCGRIATLEKIFTEEEKWSDGAFTVKLNFDDKSPGDDGWCTPNAWGWSTNMIELVEPLTGIFSTRASNEISW